MLEDNRKLITKTQEIKCNRDTVITSRNKWSKSKTKMHKMVSQTTHKDLEALALDRILELPTHFI